MKNNRKIYIVGEISDDSYLTFAKELDELENDGKGPITIELSSDGGDGRSALAFYGRIRTSPNKIVINAYGLVASAAVLILAAGDVRQMHFEGWLMVHEDGIKINDQLSKFECEAAQHRRYETQWNMILEARTGTSAAEWTLLAKETTYLHSMACQSYGIVDKLFGEEED